VVLFDVDLESWKRKAGQVANRNFTWDEWRQFFPDEPAYRRTFPDLPDGEGAAEARSASKQPGSVKPPANQPSAGNRSCAVNFRSAS